MRSSKTICLGVFDHSVGLALKLFSEIIIGRLFVKTFVELTETFQPFKRQPCETVKPTQTIRRPLQMSLLSLFDHFVGLGLKLSSYDIRNS